MVSSFHVANFSLISKRCSRTISPIYRNYWIFWHLSSLNSYGLVCSEKWNGLNSLSESFVVKAKKLGKNMGFVDFGPTLYFVKKLKGQLGLVSCTGAISVYCLIFHMIALMRWENKHTLCVLHNICRWLGGTGYALKIWRTWWKCRFLRILREACLNGFRVWTRCFWERSDFKTSGI